MTNTIFDWLFAFEKSVFLRKHFQIKKCKEKTIIDVTQRCPVQCSVLLSAVLYSALLYSALSRTVLCFTQRCPSHARFFLCPVPDSIQLYSCPVDTAHCSALLCPLPYRKTWRLDYRKEKSDIYWPSGSSTGQCQELRPWKVMKYFNSPYLQDLWCQTIEEGLN